MDQMSLDKDWIALVKPGIDCIFGVRGMSWVVANDLN